MKQYRVKEHPCPCCGAELNATTDILDGGRQPEEGDLTICAYCANVLVFGPDLVKVKASDELLMSLDEETREGIMTLLTALLEAKGGINGSDND